MGRRLGTKLSEEHKKKISEGKKNPSLETRKKLSESHKGKIGEKASHFIDGRSKNKEYVEKRRILWRKRNWEKVLYDNRQRRIIRLGNGGFHTLGEWQTLKAQYNWTCPSCHQQEPEIKLTVDHIIPISKGGSDNIENIQPLCRSCNAKKYNKIIKYNLK